MFLAGFGRFRQIINVYQYAMKTKFMIKKLKNANINAHTIKSLSMANAFIGAKMVNLIIDILRLIIFLCV